MSTSDKTSSRRRSSDVYIDRKRSPDPYVELEAGDHVCLSSPLVDPIHWQFGVVLWRDEGEILVRTSNVSGQPEKHLHNIEYVRVFGTRDHCRAEHQRAAAAVRNAANVARDVEDMAAELRRKMIDLFETVAAAAMKTSRGAAA